MCKHPALLILLTLCLLTQLTGCGILAPQQTAEPEPDPSPEPVPVYSADSRELESGHSDLLPLCAADDGFYCLSVEKTGEAIPDTVIREAKRRNREPYNDGRYDIISSKLWLLSSNGELTGLEDYSAPEPAENAEGWKNYSCIPGFEAMALSEDGRLLTLEYNVISGNSAPPRRADMVIGKNYLEYHVQWILRTLSPTGKELDCKLIEGDRAVALDALEKAAGKQPKTVEVSEVPFSWEMLGIEQKQVLSDIIYLEEGSYRFIIGTDRAEAIVTVKEELKDSDKTALILMTDSPSDLLLDAVSAFNASREDIYIHVKDFEAAAEGVTADLFYLPLQSCMEMGRSGMLADLYPFIEADKEIRKEDFFPNVLSALEVNGALYTTCTGVTFRTVIAASSLVGDKAGWTYDQLRDCWGSLGIGSDAFDIFTTCEDVLDVCLSMDLDSFIDWESHTCTFQSDGFKKLLWFTGNFPRSFDYDGHSPADTDNTDLRVRSGKQMLMEKIVCSIDDAVYCGYEYPERISFIGYPTLNGTGNVMSVSTLDSGMNFSMGAATELKEECWAFLRRFFMEDTQKETRFFPVSISVFNRMLKEAMKVEYVLDGKGNPVLDTKTGEPVISSIDTMYLSNYVQIYIFPLSENKAAKVVDLVTSTTKLALENEDICEVVKNSVRGFYDGSLSLEEAAAAAQIAVTEYLSFDDLIYNSEPLKEGDNQVG